jgi:hypothetical protein
MNIDADVNGLTAEVDSVSVFHGKSPFGMRFFVAKKPIPQKLRLASIFSNIGPAQAGIHDEDGFRIVPGMTNISGGSR